MRHADPYYASMVASSSTRGWRVALLLIIAAVAAFCRTIRGGLA